MKVHGAVSTFLTVFSACILHCLALDGASTWTALQRGAPRRYLTNHGCCGHVPILHWQDSHRQHRRRHQHESHARSCGHSRILRRPSFRPNVKLFADVKSQQQDGGDEPTEESSQAATQRSATTVDSSTIDQDYLYLERFRRRRLDVERKDSWIPPPDAALGPCEFVHCLLVDLKTRRNCRTLIDCSTPSWRDLLCRSIAAPIDTTDAVLSTKLKPVLCRATNQFAILLDAGCQFDTVFPTEPLDYGDGNAWVECRLRHKSNDELLVVTGWALRRRSSDGAWLVDGLDWQDFREDFRPGIGREEWERICG